MSAAIEALEERAERLERHEARFQEGTLDQMKRLDAVAEDLTDAIEALRRRVEALERGR